MPVPSGPVVGDIGAYVDAAELFAHWLRTVLSFDNVCHELPTNLVSVMPLVVVERFGGGDRIPTLDVARLDVDTFCPDRTTALTLAETIRQAARTDLPGYVYLNRTVVARVETISAPSMAFYDSRNTVRRATQALQITFHQFSGV